jgi:hypothetical protein
LEPQVQAQPHVASADPKRLSDFAFVSAILNSMTALERLAVRKATLSEVPVLATLAQLPDMVIVHREGDKKFVLVGNKLRPLKIVFGQKPAA